MFGSPNKNLSIFIDQVFGRVLSHQFQWMTLENDGIFHYGFIFDQSDIVANINYSVTSMIASLDVEVTELLDVILIVEVVLRIRTAPIFISRWRTILIWFCCESILPLEAKFILVVALKSASLVKVASNSLKL